MWFYGIKVPEGAVVGCIVVGLRVTDFRAKLAKVIHHVAYRTNSAPDVIMSDVSR